MAKFYFKYGVMSSSKTANLIMTAYNYESQGNRILCFKSSLDTRWSKDETKDETKKEGLIESRAIPDSHICELVQPTEDLYKLISLYNEESLKKFSSSIVAIFVDEAQFLTRKQVKQLADVVEKLKIDVFCFGLKNTYIDGELFEGSAALLYYASKIEEVKTICKYCNRKATMNLRIVNGKAVYSGDSIVIGDIVEGDETFAHVCYHHYCFPPAPIEGMYIKKNRTLMSKDFTDIFNHILKHQNSYGFYRRAREIQKEDLEFRTVLNPTPYNKEDYTALKYIMFGAIGVDAQEYAKKYSVNKKINGKIITDIIISFLYTFFENDKNTALTLLRNSQVNGIEFFENESEFEKVQSTRKTHRNVYLLPDGRHYCYKCNRNNCSKFWEHIMTGLSLYLNSDNVGFYCRK